MKGLIVIVLMVVSAVAYSQEWRDSLAVAREAYSKQEYGKALKYYRSAQEKAPDGVDFSKEMGQSAYKNLDYEQAEKIYREQAFSEKNLKEKAKAYHNLGNSLMQQKKYDEAVDAYKQSLRNDASNDKTRHNLAEAMRLKNEEQCKKQNQQDNKDQQDQQENQQDKQNQQNQQNQQQNQQQQQGSQGKQGQQQQGQGQQQQNQSGGGQTKGQPGSPKLQDKAVEKKLDELMKQESATKRNMGGGGKTSSGSSGSGKDW